MLFLNYFLLAGLGAIAVPIVIHLLNRRSAATAEWGAVRFLVESLVRRRRQIMLEEVLVLGSRCLLVALAVLAVARPYVPPGARIPYGILLPLLLLAVMALGASFALWSAHDREPVKLRTPSTLTRE